MSKDDRQTRRKGIRLVIGDGRPKKTFLGRALQYLTAGTLVVAGAAALAFGLFVLVAFFAVAVVLALPVTLFFINRINKRLAQMQRQDRIEEDLLPDSEHDDSDVIDAEYEVEDD
ncbi:MAG: hypothetical protein U5N86_05215 [Planctomycetota bacterium]|nr:hypothetical protein [Planctomycetota bacterium]